MAINIKKLDERAVVPKRGSLSAAGYDLCAVTKTGAERIPAGETRMIGTGIAMEIPEGYAGFVFARSGLAAKRGLRPANCVGVIDADYRGEVMIALHNDSDTCQSIHDGDRIAQLIIMPFGVANFQEVEELSETCRGKGGFGSTGLNN